MSRRNEVFRFRLSDEEKARFNREAAEAGLSKADLIRKALGWESKAAPKGATSAAAAAVVTPPKGPKADPATEPGKAAIEELAKRISGGSGVPMRVARNEAKTRLKKAAPAA